MNGSAKSSNFKNSATTPGYRDARRFPWTKEEDALLGKFYDRIVGEMLGRTLHCVRGRRIHLGIRGCGGPRKPRTIQEGAKGPKYSNYPLWSVEEEQKLGTQEDRKLYRQFPRTRKAVRHRREMKRIRLTKAWSKEDDKVLGIRTDSEIAALLKRSNSNVHWRRKKLGIAAYHSLNRWLPEQLALLGTMPDAEVARITAHSFKSVEGKRIALGRPKFDPRFPLITRKQNASASATKTFMKKAAPYCTWTPAQDSLLGKFSDGEVAARLGCSWARVRRRRRLLGLPNNNPTHRQWTAKEIALLGTKSDREIAKRLNRSVAVVRWKRLKLRIPFSNPHYEVWTDDQIPLLGAMPDKEVARITGHSVSSVKRARARRGIFSVRRQAPDWTPEQEALLGTKPDSEIAASLNRTLGAVRLRRVQKNIPVFRPMNQGPHSQTPKHRSTTALPDSS